MPKNFKPKKAKPKKFDGLNDDDKKKIVTALRKVWSWSYSRRLVVNRCLIKDGFSKCEGCGAKCAKVFVDHTNQVGEFSLDIIKKMFVPSTDMKGLCKTCHDKKTKEENKRLRQIKFERQFENPELCFDDLLK